MRLTQSVLSTAGDCQLRAQYTLEPPPWVKRTAGSTRAVGTGFHAGNELLPAMTTVRAAADKLEGLVADDLWPLATYQEMLFIL